MLENTIHKKTAQRVNDAVEAHCDLEYNKDTDPISDIPNLKHLFTCPLDVRARRVHLLVSIMLVPRSNARLKILRGGRINNAWPGMT